MHTTSPPPAAAAGPGLVLRLANGPYGRALVGVALGLALFAAQQRGWFCQADLPALERERLQERYDDEPLSPEELAAIEEADEARKRGDKDYFIPWEEVKKELGL